MQHCVIVPTETQDSDPLMKFDKHSPGRNCDCDYRNDICDASGETFVMCPECDVLCDYGHLNDSCHYARLTYIFDNYATIAVAVFMSAWGLLMLSYFAFFYRRSLMINPFTTDPVKALHFDILFAIFNLLKPSFVIWLHFKSSAP